VNYAKFGTMFSVPYSKQVYTAFSADRRAMLQANGGSVFGLKFVPTTLLQYARPDALRMQSSFPFVTFPSRGPLIGHVVFDVRDIATSVPASMPLYTLLAVIGLIAIVRNVSRLRVIAVGAAAGIVPVIAIGAIANRYLADFIPLLVVASVGGLHVVLRRAQGTSRTRLRLGATVFLILAAFSVWANYGLADVYQQSWNPPVAPVGTVRTP
jgi:hypothetical protein